MVKRCPSDPEGRRQYEEDIEKSIHRNLRLMILVAILGLITTLVIFSG